MARHFSAIGCLVLLGLSQIAPADEYDTIKYSIDTNAFETALFQLKKATNEDSLSSVETDILTSLLMIESGKPSRGIELLKSAELRTTRLEGDIAASRARGYLALGDYEVATQFAQEALKEDTHNISAQLVVLQIDNYLNNTIDHSAYETLLKQSNQDLSVWIAYLEQTLRFDPTRQDIARRAFIEVGSVGLIEEFRGRFAFQTGDHRGAVVLFEKALAQYQIENNEIGENRVRRWLEVNAQIEPRRSPDRQSMESKPRTNPTSKPVTPPAKIPNNPGAPDLTKDQFVSDEEIEPIKVVTQGDIQTGSGFITHGGRWIITNRHVIENADRVLVRNGLGKIRHVSEIRIDNKQDLAVLVLEKAYPEEFAASLEDITDPVGGDELYLMGYPLIAILGDHHPSITEGIVSKGSGFGDRSSEFLITANLNQGNSGGPIYGVDGRILGIAVAKLDKTKMLKETGDIPEDVNIGIKGSQIRRFLALESPPRQTRGDSLTPRQAYSQLRRQVVMVVSIDD